MINNLNQIERIKIKINLAKNTDSFCEVFGADSHNYILGDPIDNLEIISFETKYNIELPKEYKVFLTEIGNGGNEYNSVVGNSAAGPDYGIFKLGHKYHFIADPTTGYLTKKPFYNGEMSDKEWDPLSEMEDEDLAFEKGYSGIFVIGFSGCSGFTGIVLSGEDTGRIVHVYDEIEYKPHFDKENNFLDWYESWLDRIITGQKFISGKPFLSEEKHFLRFEEVPQVHKSENHQHWKLIALKYIRGFDKLNSLYIEKIKKYLHIESDEIVCLYLISLLVKFDYENTKDEMVELQKNNVLEFLKNLHLYAPSKIIDWKMNIQDIRETTNNQEVKEYIDFVIMKDLKEYL